jgi:hypothetical protein
MLNQCFPMIKEILVFYNANNVMFDYSWILGKPGLDLHVCVYQESLISPLW